MWRRRLRLRSALLIPSSWRAALRERRNSAKIPRIGIRLRNPDQLSEARDPRKTEARMHALKTAVVGLALISGATLARADVITDWNKTAMEVMKAVNVAGNPWTRTLAMVHVSMSDSVNAVQDRYGRSTPEIPTDPKASAEAAAAAAAREILMRQYPGQKALIDAAFAATLDNVPDSPARVAGIALGEKIAATVFVDRQNDAT